jgi:acetyl esterase/lipase
MKQNSRIQFSVGLLLFCAVTFPPAHANNRAEAGTQNRKVESVQAQEETVNGPVSGNFKFERVIRNIDYCGGGEGRQMDIYSPLTMSHKPAPALIYVHGGGWKNGDKSTGGAGVIHEVTSRGFVVAAVNYRLFSAQGGLHNTFPVMIEDVKCAVRYLRAHATQYNLDPKRFGAWGWSAGGHLVSLLGTSDDSDWPPTAYPARTARIQAVVDMYGPADLAAPDYCVHSCREIFGSSVDDRRRASPITYATSDDPPFLIIQGDQDTLVPPSQSQELLQKLQAAGVSAKLVVVANAGHMLKPTPTEAQISPSQSQIDKMVADFFDQHLNH